MRENLWCLKQFQQGKESEKRLSIYLGISTRRFRKLYALYKQTKGTSLPKPKMIRPKKAMLAQWEEIVNAEWKKHHLNAVYLERIITQEQKQRIPHNTIHKIMLEKGFAKEQQSKKKRRKPWIRYEREHSLLAVHMDWHISKAVPGKRVWVVLDDASRKILSGGEFSNATSENSVLLLKEALEHCRSNYNLSIRECISDHGTQFFADKRDKQGNADHVFEVFLKAQGVKQVLCGVNHSQTNGEVEEWFDFYEHYRARYASMAALVDWYNDRMHGSFNMRVCGSPNRVFIRKMPPECWMLMAEELFRW